jgi:pimeloyl-ACP methyl ester carboxylesterase
MVDGCLEPATESHRNYMQRWHPLAKDRHICWSAIPSAASTFGSLTASTRTRVRGLVLIDTTQEDHYRLLPRAWSNLGAATLRRARRQAFWAPVYIDLGIARLQLRLQGRQVPSVLLQSKYLKARTSEFENIEVSAEQARKADHIGNKPLVVLTAGRVIDAGLKAALSKQDQMAYEQTWVNDLQLRLARLSKRGRRVVVADSSHEMPADRPDAILAAVRELCAPQNQP